MTFHENTYPKRKSKEKKAGMTELIADNTNLKQRFHRFSAFWLRSSVKQRFLGIKK